MKNIIADSYSFLDKDKFNVFETDYPGHTVKYEPYPYNSFRDLAKIKVPKLRRRFFVL